MINHLMDWVRFGLVKWRAADKPTIKLDLFGPTHFIMSSRLAFNSIIGFGPSEPVLWSDV